MATEDENQTPEEPATETPSAQPESVDTQAETTDAAVASDQPTAETPADPVAAAMAAAGDDGPATPAADAAVADSADAATETPAEDGIAADLTLGEGAPAEADAGPKPAPVIRGKVDRFGVAMGTGRRKTSIARVRVKSGQGEITINGKSVEDYFPVERDQHLVYAPLEVTETRGKVDVWCRVEGGGTTGQAGAVVLGIARALQAVDANHHESLQHNGLLTRDERMVERKKPGRKKARRGFQFSKR